MPMRAKFGDTIADIVGLIGEAGIIALAENFGGTRLYVPHDPKPDCELVAAIGMVAVKRLSARFTGDQLPVPLMRELRAKKYREEGLSNAKIAVRLGIHEASVNRIFRRLADEGAITLK